MDLDSGMVSLDAGTVDWDDREEEGIDYFDGHLLV